MFKFSYIPPGIETVPYVVREQLWTFMDAADLRSDQVGAHEGWKDWRLGLSAGPSIEIDNLVHEWAHIVQMTPKETERVSANDLGFTVPYAEWARCYDPSLWKKPWAALREAEVFAIQIKALHHLFGRDITSLVYACAELSKFLPSVPIHLEWPYEIRYTRWMARRIAKHLHGIDFAESCARFHSNMCVIERRRKVEENEQQRDERSKRGRSVGR